MVAERANKELPELADYIVPFTLRAICDLRIADHLAAGPLPIDELARVSGSHERSLYRAMRVLASKGVFSEVEPRVFALTELAEPLRSDHPRSLRQAYPLLTADVQAWAMLGHTLRTGEPAFDVAHGKGAWEWFAEHPEESARFDASQQAVTRREVPNLIPAYDWAAFDTVADIGGGNGAFVSAILAANPGMRGFVLDQPHVVSRAEQIMAEQGVADRCRAIGGSYLDEIPAGAQVYTFKRVLYSLPDEAATQVLRNARSVLPADGRVLIIEPVVRPGNEFDWGKLYDLLLLTMSGGGGRTEEELTELLAKADLELIRIIPTRSLPIVEARAA